jgi:hypothetical protein
MCVSSQDRAKRLPDAGRTPEIALGDRSIIVEQVMPREPGTQAFGGIQFLKISAPRTISSVHERLRQAQRPRGLSWYSPVVSHNDPLLHNLRHTQSHLNANISASSYLR